MPNKDPSIITKRVGGVWDWAAYHDGDEGRYWYYGWGHTQDEAVDDLKRLDREFEEEEQDIFEGMTDEEYEKDAEYNERRRNAMEERGD